MSHAGFENAADALDFIFSGKAVVTLTSAATGTHFTLKLSVPKDNEDNDFFFVNHLFGPDNSWNGDWAFLGCVAVKPTGTTLFAGRKGKPDAPSFKALAWTLKHLAAGSIPETLTIQHNDQCGRCGRELTNPTSIAKGIGPTCAGKD
jgi:hypothetical protein